MLGRATGAMLVGIDAHLVEVEVDLGGGLPAIAAVGLPGVAVREGIDRIRAALRHAGFKLPQHRVTVNLAPAEVRKHGASLDLPIAVALLTADGQMPARGEDRVVLAGELGLDGILRPVRGALSIGVAARRAGRRTLVVPEANADEAALVEGVEVIPVGSLADVVAVWRGARPAPRRRVDAARVLAAADPGAHAGDLAEVRGQAGARRALEIAAAGGHHLLLCGPPGSGKSMLARRLSGILPPLGVEEALEVTRVHSAAGLGGGLLVSRPFRAPHHGITPAGLAGGGLQLRPGEMSLATAGVLHLDELPEFRREVLETLRQPLEDGTITVVRVHASATFPARFLLVAAMNPCPCGYHGSPRRRCQCTPGEVKRYRSRISGPLLDRLDIAVDVPPVDLKVLGGEAAGESSAEVRRRVVEARERQRARWASGGPRSNGRLGPRELDRFAALRPGARELLVGACERLGVSARGFDRARRVARTIADLEGSDAVEIRHVAEAIQYRLPAV